MLLHDANTRKLARELWDRPGALSDPAVRDALNACMPLYEVTHWPSHRAMSHAFLAKLGIQLEGYEETMAKRLRNRSKAPGRKWP